jgi:hypothetical protein
LSRRGIRGSNRIARQPVVLESVVPSVVVASLLVSPASLLDESSLDESSLDESLLEVAEPLSSVVDDASTSVVGMSVVLVLVLVSVPVVVASLSVVPDDSSGGGGGDVPTDGAWRSGHPAPSPTSKNAPSHVRVGGRAPIT